jgi:anthranilate synthase component 2
MRVTVVDNFDSFTYNLVQALLCLGAEVEVFRNDAATPEELVSAGPDRILISPGPGGPPEAGISTRVIEAAAGRIPLLGVYLGHQCLAAAFGGRVIRTKPMHGKTSQVHHQGEGLFAHLPSPFRAARYHSLAVDPASLPKELAVTAWTSDGLIMGLAHRHMAMWGVQFHPESFMTPLGSRLLESFLSVEFRELVGHRRGLPEASLLAIESASEANE